MNNKRQTIWLVSMLSLMVILSAYYLFTEDVTPPSQSAAEAEQASDAAERASGALDSSVGDIQVNIVDPIDGSAQDVSSGNTDSGVNGAGDITDTNGVSGANGAISTGDEAVLNEYANLKGRQYFDQLQRLREERFDSENERLSAIVADTKNHSQEDASAAWEELARLDDTDQRITSLEVKLQQDFENAVVTEEETNFKVIVQASALDKKQAVQIIDLATKELKVTPDRLSVQFVD